MGQGRADPAATGMVRRTVGLVRDTHAGAAAAAAAAAAVVVTRTAGAALTLVGAPRGAAALVGGEAAGELGLARRLFARFNG